MKPIARLAAVRVAALLLRLMDALHDRMLPIGGCWYALRWRLVRYIRGG